MMFQPCDFSEGGKHKLTIYWVRQWMIRWNLLFTSKQTMRVSSSRIACETWGTWHWKYSNRYNRPFTFLLDTHLTKWSPLVCGLSITGSKRLYSGHLFSLRPTAPRWIRFQCRNGPCDSFWLNKGYYGQIDLLCYLQSFASRLLYWSQQLFIANKVRH